MAISKKRSKISILTTFLVSLTGCFTTELPEVPGPSALPQLINAAEIQMPLKVAIGDESENIGYQYMLFGIPVARVDAPFISAVVRNALTTHAGVGQIGLMPPSEYGLENPRVEVRVSKLRVNGYDFLFFRRPAASITMVGTFHQRPGRMRECEVTGEYAEFAKFAFADDLNRVLEQASDTAAEQLVSCLGLTYSDMNRD